MSKPSTQDLISEAYALGLCSRGVSKKADVIKGLKKDPVFIDLLNRYDLKNYKDLTRYLDECLPGVFSGDLAVNCDPDRAAVVASKLTTHTLKLSHAKAPGFGFVPVDNVTHFNKSDVFVGAHTVPLATRYDCAAGAQFAPYVRQVKHVLAHGGRYALPPDLSVEDLPGPLPSYIARLQEVIKSTGAVDVRAAVHFGVTQVLLPDDESGTGYISVTPVVCGGLVAELSRKLKDRNTKDQTSPVDAVDALGFIPQADYMSAASMNALRNVSSFIGPGSRILAARPPVSSVQVREALWISHDLPGWVGRFLNRHARKQDALGRDLLAFKRLFFRMDAAGSTNSRQRGRLARHIRFQSAAVFNRFQSLTGEHIDLFERSGTTIPDDKALASTFASQINVWLKGSAAPELVDQWAAEAREVIRNKKEPRHVDQS